MGGTLVGFARRVDRCRVRSRCGAVLVGLAAPARIRSLRFRPLLIGVSGGGEEPVRAWSRRAFALTGCFVPPADGLLRPLVAFGGSPAVPGLVVQEVAGGDAGVRDKTEVLEQGRSCEAGGSGVFPRRCRRESADLGPGQHGVVPQPTRHIDMCLAACGGPVLRLVKSVWRWCFPGLGEDGGRAPLPATADGFGGRGIP